MIKAFGIRQYFLKYSRLIEKNLIWNGWLLPRVVILHVTQTWFMQIHGKHVRVEGLKWPKKGAFSGTMTTVIAFPFTGGPSHSTKSNTSLKVVYHSRKCMKILGFLLKGRGGGGYLKTLLAPRVLMEGLGMVCMYIVTWHGVTWLHSAHLNSLSDRQDRLQNYLESESKLHKFAVFWVICWCPSSSSRAEKA